MALNLLHCPANPWVARCQSRRPWFASKLEMLLSLPFKLLIFKEKSKKINPDLRFVYGWSSCNTFDSILGASAGRDSSSLKHPMVKWKRLCSDQLYLPEFRMKWVDDEVVIVLSHSRGNAQEAGLAFLNEFVAYFLAGVWRGNRIPVMWELRRQQVNHRDRVWNINGEHHIFIQRPDTEVHSDFGHRK